MRSIVVGYVESREGEAAMEVAISEARRRGDRLVVVHSMLGGSEDKAQDYLASAEAMERIRQRLTAESIEHSLHEYVRGQSPAKDLIQAADENDAELIVIGIRRRTTTGKLLLGSNALEILHEAPTPVLCVKASDR
ncbi:MAG TPA: universal stress protein [Acidimicrobiia bacterium]|nr:universal stress protein [Acidimicrobiia bacterium]